MNTVNVRWFDGYHEKFEATEVRFGSDLLWMRLSNGENRHIPLRGVRTFSLSEESHFEDGNETAGVIRRSGRYPWGSEKERKGNTKYADVDKIVFETRGEAEDVLAKLNELVDNYGQATVADLLDLVGLPTTLRDNQLEWTNLRNAEVVRVKDGYTLKMPMASDTLTKG